MTPERRAYALMRIERLEKKLRALDEEHAQLRGIDDRYEKARRSTRAAITRWKKELAK